MDWEGCLRPRQCAGEAAQAARVGAGQVQRACRVCARTGDTGSERPAPWTPRPCGVVSAAPSRRSGDGGTEDPETEGGRPRHDGRDRWGRGNQKVASSVGTVFAVRTRGPPEVHCRCSGQGQVKAEMCISGAFLYGRFRLWQ